MPRKRAFRHQNKLQEAFLGLKLAFKAVKPA